jgi:hypothetical protein
VSPKKKPKQRDESSRDDATYSVSWTVEGPVPLSDATYSVTWTVEGPVPLSDDVVQRSIAALKKAPIVDVAEEHPPGGPSSRTISR